MKTFENALNRSRSNVLLEQRETALKDRYALIAAMKKKFGVDDLSECLRTDRIMYRKMLDEMWNKNTGITEAGKRFIAESEIPLNESADDETVFMEVKRRIKAKEGDILSCLLKNKQCKELDQIKRDIEEKIGRAIKVGDFKKAVMEFAGNYICKVINAYRLA